MSALCTPFVVVSCVTRISVSTRPAQGWPCGPLLAAVLLSTSPPLEPVAEIAVAEIAEIASDWRSSMLVGQVVPPDELGVTFDCIGALEHVKETLREVVMLPLQRPEVRL